MSQITFTARMKLKWIARLNLGREKAGLRVNFFALLVVRGIFGQGVKENAVIVIL